jgi:hypothetical protein
MQAMTRLSAGAMLMIVVVFILAALLLLGFI